MDAISNPDHDESSNIVVAVGIVTSFAVLTVAARLYVRTVMLRSFGWDDALITLTIVCSIVGFALAVVQTRNGAGRHRGDTSPETYEYGMFINFVNQPIYLFAVCFVKLAVGASLVRIANERKYKILIYSIGGFMLFYTIMCFFVMSALILDLPHLLTSCKTIMFQCTDVRVLWNPAVKATCWDATTIEALSYTNSSLNILTDLLFSIFIPVPMLYKLHINRRQKVILMCILGLGIFACVAAAVKVSFLPNYGKKGDFLWDSRNITIWTATELNVAIVAASLPCLKPLFKQVLGSTYGRGSNVTSRAKHQKSKSWQELRDTRRKSTKKSVTNDTESQTALELADLDVQAFVHDKSGTTTEIGQVARHLREDDLSEAAVPGTETEKNIYATTVTSVHYSR